MSSTALLKSVLVAAVLGIVALISVWLQQPLLAPSLGSAVFVQVMSSNEPSARPWNTAVGQFCGLVAGLIGVFVATAFDTPSFMGSNPLFYARVLAVVIAVLLTVLFQLAAKANSPAGGATAIVLAIGLETANWQGAARLVFAILLVTGLGEAFRRLVLRTERGS